MTRYFLIVFFVSVTGVVFFGLQSGVSGEKIQDVITYDGSPTGGATQSVYPSVYTGKVVFSHEKHVEKYGAGCGDCHHDDSGEPLESPAPDEVNGCVDCHSEEGLVRGPIQENEMGEDMISQRPNALHQQCIGCHKVFNNKKKFVSAPEACRGCHALRPAQYKIK
jgi:hypothetical protein